MTQMLGVGQFGPNGVVNGNSLSSIGQGLKKIFKPQPEYPRIFRSDEEGDLGKQKRGSNSGVLTIGECPCNLLDLDILLGIFSGENLKPSSWRDFDSVNETLNDGSVWKFEYVIDKQNLGEEDGNYPTDGRIWKRQSACLRFVCRCVSGGSVKQAVFGGPTTYDRDIWNEIIEPNFGFENSSGNYLYIVDFYAWRSKRSLPTFPIRIWVSDDRYYDIGKFTITKQ